MRLFTCVSRVTRVATEWERRGQHTQVLVVTDISPEAGIRVMMRKPTVPCVTKAAPEAGRGKDSGKRAQVPSATQAEQEATSGSVISETHTRVYFTRHYAAPRKGRSTNEGNAYYTNPGSRRIKGGQESNYRYHVSVQPYGKPRRNGRREEDAE